MKKGVQLLIRTLIYITLVLYSILPILAENTENNKLSSYEGLHFMVGFMENESNIAEPNKLLEQKIFVSSSSNATLSVKFGSLSPVQYKVNPNEVLTINVSRAYENTVSEVPQRNLVEITSDFPIAVYAYSTIPRSSDSYAVIPISNWGTEYVAVSLPNDQYNKKTLDSIKDFTPRSSQFMVMAAYDNTKVTIIPSSLTRQIKQIDQSYDVILQKGQCYLVQSWQYARGAGDLTGSIVRADKPVGMLSGHVRSALMQGFIEQPPDSKDHLIEMLMPTSAWGNTFVTIPFGTNPSFGDFFKVVTKDLNVVIDIETENNKQEVRLYDNKVFELAGLKEPALWRASAPIQIAQFMYRTGDTSEGFFYDPSLLIIPPVEQFVNRIMFNTPDESFAFSDGIKFNNHYVTVVAQEEALPFIMLDNKLLKNNPMVIFKKVPVLNLFWATINLEAGSHELLSTQGRFAGTLFGVGRFDSYAMTLGSSLNNPYSDDNSPPTITVLEDCGKLKGTITDAINDESFGIYYAWVQTDSTTNYSWIIDPIQSDAKFITFTAEPIDKFKDGKFILDFTDKSGNQGRYVFNYDAIKLDYPAKITLPSMDYNDSLCFDIVVKNNGKRSIDFVNIDITNDSRVKMLYKPNAPSVLKAGDSIVVTLCLNPKGNSNSFYGRVNLTLGCDTDIEIPYVGNLVALELDTKGIDFGKVLIGDRNCSAASVTNNGNSAVWITSLEFDNIFEIDTVGIFPYLLAAGETLNIPVCFKPLQREFYIDQIVFINEFNINTSAEIKGTGVAPLLNNLSYDFGKYRVGSSKSIDKEFINTGNQDTKLSFISFKEQSHSPDDLSAALESLDGITVNMESNYNVELVHIPQDTNDYRIVAAYTSDWQLHPEITISAIAKGTIPVIETRDVNFGNVNVFSQTTLTPEIIFSKGNETLTIDKIFVQDGDIESFGIDFDILKNFTINENNAFSTAILFKPNRIGFHELTLGVIHDAKPNFERDTAFIKIVGFAGGPDSYNVETELIIDDVIACNYTSGIFKIKNLGEKVFLTNILVKKSNDDFLFELNDFVQQYIDKGQSVEFPVRVFAERNKQGKVAITSVFFETDSLINEYDILPASKPILVDNLPKIIYAAGDTVLLKISGQFPFGIDTLTSFKLGLDVKMDYLMLLNENISLNLNNFSENLKYNLNISKTKDKLEFFLNENLIKIIDNAKWSIDLEFFGLLSDEINGNWDITVSDNKCHDNGTGKLLTELDSVCMYSSRRVFYDSSRPQVNIYPNPADDVLRLKTMFPENVNNAKIIVSDNLGINYTLAENVNIKKGTDFLEFNISHLSNGTYFVKFESKILNKNILFVIIR